VQPRSGAACEWRGVGLFRGRTSATRYRYFLGKFETDKKFLEGHAIHDAMQNQPLTITISAASGVTSFSLPLAPPQTVRRLLVALCDPDPRSFGRVWTLHESTLLPVLLAALRELNCETAHHE
jgi:hypothetical protein